MARYIEPNICHFNYFFGVKISSIKHIQNVVWVLEHFHDPQWNWIFMKQHSFPFSVPVASGASPLLSALPQTSHICATSSRSGNKISSAHQASCSHMSLHPKVIITMIFNTRDVFVHLLTLYKRSCRGSCTYVSDFFSSKLYLEIHSY
jgi:hypothetical protein